MGENLTYQRRIDIIESNQPQVDFTIADYERLTLENEKLRATTPSTPVPILQELLHANQLLLQKMQNLEASHKEIISRLNAMQTRTTTVWGPRLQKIHPGTPSCL